MWRVRVSPDPLNSNFTLTRRDVTLRARHGEDYSHTLTHRRVRDLSVKDTVLPEYGEMSDMSCRSPHSDLMRDRDRPSGPC